MHLMHNRLNILLVMLCLRYFGSDVCSWWDGLELCGDLSLDPAIYLHDQAPEIPFTAIRIPSNIYISISDINWTYFQHISLISECCDRLRAIETIRLAIRPDLHRVYHRLAM